MGHVASAAFPAGLGLGLHPQPVPHPTLVGMLGVSTGPVLAQEPATGLVPGQELAAGQLPELYLID